MVHVRSLPSHYPDLSASLTLSRRLFIPAEKKSVSNGCNQDVTASFTSASVCKSLVSEVLSPPSYRHLTPISSALG